MGETAGPFELLNVLGKNELGETFLAGRGGKVCGVLKRFSLELSTNVSFRAALETDLKLAAELKHPHIAAVLEQGMLDGRCYVLVEALEGAPLSSLIQAAQVEGPAKGWPLSMGRAASVLGPVLEALAAGHALTPALLHRDLAPDNVWLTPQGRVVLTDFGIGRARLRAGGGSGLRRAYVSPEQARGLASDPRSEVFAAGLLLFELACGRLPALGGPGEVISHIATGELDSPRAVNPALDPSAAAVLERALAQRPEDRFASATEFLEALRPWTTTAQEPVPLSEWVTQLKQVKLAPPKAPAAAPVAAAARTPSPAAAAGVIPIIEPPKLPATAPVQPTPAKHRNRRMVAFFIVFGVALLARATYSTWRPMVTPSIAPGSEARRLEVTTAPSGALVFVDGVGQGATPHDLYLTKDSIHHLTVRRAGTATWTGIVQNTSRLHIDLVTGDIEEERYEGERPKRDPSTPPAAEQVDKPQGTTMAEVQQKAVDKEVVFDIESPPVATVLTRAHRLAVDEVEVTDIPDGAEVAVVASPQLFQSAPNVGALMRSQAAKGQVSAYSIRAAQNYNPNQRRKVNVFGLRLVGDRVEVVDLYKPTSLIRGGAFRLFTPIDPGFERTKVETTVTVGRQIQALGWQHQLRVEADDSFMVRVLEPRKAYRLEVHAVDSKQPMSPVIISFRTPPGFQDTSLKLDGRLLEVNQALLSAGVHTFTGATSLWLTLPGLEGAEPPKVALSILEKR